MGSIDRTVDMVFKAEFAFCLTSQWWRVPRVGQFTHGQTFRACGIGYRPFEADRTHNPKVVGSNLTPSTNSLEL
jgi:hypothetical protein